MQHEDEFADNSGIDPNEFLEMCVGKWAKHGQDRHELSKAMLVASVNILIEEDSVDETASLLIGLAGKIKPPVVS